MVYQEWTVSQANKDLEDSTEKEVVKGKTEKKANLDEMALTARKVLRASTEPRVLEVFLEIKVQEVKREKRVIPYLETL